MLASEQARTPGRARPPCGSRGRPRPVPEQEGPRALAAITDQHEQLRLFAADIVPRLERAAPIVAIVSGASRSDPNSPAPHTLHDVDSRTSRPRRALAANAPLRLAADQSRRNRLGADQPRTAPTPRRVRGWSKPRYPSGSPRVSRSFSSRRPCPRAGWYRGLVGGRPGCTDWPYESRRVLLDSSEPMHHAALAGSAAGHVRRPGGEPLRLRSLQRGRRQVQGSVLVRGERVAGSRCPPDGDAGARQRKRRCRTRARRSGICSTRAPAKQRPNDGGVDRGRAWPLRPRSSPSQGPSASAPSGAGPVAPPPRRRPTRP